MSASSIAIALERFTTFGDLLKYLRRCAGLTQLELSIAVGYGDAQISRLEQNERLPDLATLTARFLPVLQIEDRPDVAARLLELAEAVRREDSPAAGLPPYKGLYFFDEQDAGLFYGREELTASLVEQLAGGAETGPRVLTVIGASGSGKSSVVRAGVIPALRWQQPSAEWPILVLTPTAHPLGALAKTCCENSRGRWHVSKLEHDLAARAATLGSALRILAQSAGTAQALVVVDQFEELFTLCRSNSEQAAFIDNLLVAASERGGTGILLLVMRADFYSHCANFANLRKAIAANQEYIGPMEGDSLRRAIEEPARRGHWEIEPGLVELLLHDIGADKGRTPEPGALPLLSHALLETWQRRRGRRLTLSGYTAAGGVRGAIAETAEAVFHDQLAPEQRAIARQIFLRLTELGETLSTAGTRRRVRFDELVRRADERQLVREVLTKLADARLVITEQDTAQVAHEALIREWPTLQNWLEEDRDSLRLHRRLTEAAQEWEASDQDPGILYRGSRLVQAVEWATSHPDELNLQERTFLDACQILARQEVEKREAQRERELVATRQLAESERRRAEDQAQSNTRLTRRARYLAAMSILAMTLAIVAFVFLQRAQRSSALATSRELAAASVNSLQIDPERSVLLALTALKSADSLEARNALHRALPELHLQSTILSGHEGGAPSLAYSPDGSHLVSIGASGDVKMWNATGGKLVFSLPTEPGEVGFSVAFSPNGKHVAAALKDKIILIDPATGKIEFTLAGMVEGAPNNEVVRLVFSPDGDQLAVANMDGAPQVWDVRSRSRELSLRGHNTPCDGIAYNPAGSLIATSDDGGVIKIWDAVSGRELRTLVHSGNVHSVAFSSDGEKFASASEDGTLRIWDVNSGDELLRLAGTSGLYSVAFIPGGHRIAASGQDGTTRIWDSDSGQALLNLAGNTSTVITVAVSPDGRSIATSAYDGSIKFWDTLPGRELDTLAAHSATVWDVAHSPDGKWIASVSDDATAKLWDAGSKELLRTMAAAEGLTSLAFTPDGTRLAAGSSGGRVYVWDTASGELNFTLEAHTYLVFDVVFSPDGTQLLTSSWDGTAKLWLARDGQELQTFPGQWAGVAFSPDGSTIFTAGLDRYVHQWNASSGAELQRLSDGTQDLYAVSVSPDGKLLAVGNQDGTISLWDPGKKQLLRVLAGHAGLVPRLVFSRDGSLLASASFDRLAKVWDPRTGAELYSLYGNTADVFSVSFSPDGDTLASAGADGTVRTYTTRESALIGLAESRVRRSLTPAECSIFLHRSCP